MEGSAIATVPEWCPVMGSWTCQPPVDRLAFAELLLSAMLMAVRCLWACDGGRGGTGQSGVAAMATAGLRVRSEGAGKTGAAVTVPYRQHVDWEVVP